MAIRLKNITNSAIVLQMFKTDRPLVNFLEQDPILLLEPGEDVDTHYWLVTNNNDPSFNEDLVDSYIQKGILSKIVVA